MNRMHAKWRLPRERSAILAAGFVLCSLNVGACDEPFPPYEEPTDVLAGSIVLTAPDTIRATYDPVSGLFFLSSIVKFDLNITNAYDNLLQGDAQIEGRILVQSLAAIARTSIVEVTAGDLRTPPILSGTIAVPPGKAAGFSAFWYPEGTDGKMVFEGLPSTPTPDGNCFGPIPFEVEVRMQIFERVQPIAFRGAPFTRVFCVKNYIPTGS